MKHNKLLMGSRHLAAPARARVLVVDDDRDILIFVRLVLENEGIDVICAENGSQALELLASNTCAVMITDQNMPLMNGFELAHRARRLKPELTVFMGTGHIYPGIQAQAQSAGIRQVFGKPFNFPHLFAALHEVLNADSIGK
jgi:CheY-like chemotaxis protein